MAHKIETLAVNASDMEVFVFEPNGPGPHPGLILAQHIPVGHTGIENDEFTLRTAERFAAAGYVVAAPFIFHWWPKQDEMKRKAQESRDDWTVLDLQATYQLLADRRDMSARSASRDTAGAGVSPGWAPATSLNWQRARSFTAAVSSSPWEKVRRLQSAWLIASAARWPAFSAMTIRTPPRQTLMTMRQH